MAKNVSGKTKYFRFKETRLNDVSEWIECHSNSPEEVRPNVLREAQGLEWSWQPNAGIGHSGRFLKHYLATSNRLSAFASSGLLVNPYVRTFIWTMRIDPLKSLKCSAFTLLPNVKKEA